MPDEVATGGEILLFPVVFRKEFSTRIVVEHGVQSTTIGPVDPDPTVVCRPFVLLSDLFWW